jgi:tRNA-binding protein
MTITYQEFERVDLRCGTIVKVEKFLRATKPAYKIWADFGAEIGVLQTSAQVTVHYTPEILLDKKNCRLCKFRREKYSWICI